MTDLKYKIFPFYFPQFYSTQENDEWWGKGFTDWELVKAAKPIHPTQNQPRVPDAGYYDQSLPDTILKQSQLAKQYGISGFNFYHYWFDGKVLLDCPIQNLLKNKAIDIEYFITWANETWTRQWIGRPNDILIKQEHNPDEKVWNAHYEYLKPFFKDERYYKINNAPVFCIYRAELIRELSAWIKFMDRKARQDGFGGIHFIALRAYDIAEPERVYQHFSKIVNFQPRYSINRHLKNNSTVIKFLEKTLRSSPEWMQLKIATLLGNRKYKKFNYLDFIDSIKKDPIYWKGKPVYQAVFPDWDNAPRYNERATFFESISHENFEKALRVIKGQVDKYDDKLIFVNAWNEWSEGAYLEPDINSGCKYLETINKVFSK